MLAVGLTDGGLLLYNLGSGLPQLMGIWGGMATVTGAQTPVTALAFDPAGSGMLSVALLSPGNVGYVIRVRGDGTVGGVTPGRRGGARTTAAACWLRAGGSGRTVRRW
jgi:hypothetical protein